MATPAAILQVMVEANTRSAMTSLSKFDSALKRTDKTTATATTRTTALGKASRSAGSHLGTAARYAAGAAAAYLSIAQAKAAVTVTQDLAKTTAGLHRNLDLSTKTASRWGAVAKARDIDTKSLNMSFTTLSRRLVDARKGTEAAKETFADLGLTTKDLRSTQGNFHDQLLQVADAFGDAEGGATRQQAAQKLLGRGYQTILPLFAEGSKSLKEQMHWADEYGATLNNTTLKAQMDLVQAQRESKVAWLGLQMVFAKAVTPALQDLNNRFQYLARILNNPDMTSAEKWEAIGKVFKGLGEKVLDAFTKVLPGIIDAAGKAAPKIAGAVVRGFLQADIWGKLLVGGWLISKLGGLGAVVGIGKMIGARLGIGIAAGTAASTAAGDMFGINAARTKASGATAGKWLSAGMLGAVGVAVGAGIAGVFTSGGILDTIKGHGATWGTKLGQAMATAFGPVTEKLLRAKVPKALETVRDEVGATIAKIHDMGQEVPADLQNLYDSLDKGARKAREATGKMRESVRQLREGFFDNLGDIRRKTDENMEAIKETLGTKSAQGRKLLAQNFDAAVKAIRKAMREGRIATDKGQEAINDLLRKQLKSFGISDSLIARDVGRTVAKTKSGKIVGGQQKGGIIVPGQGSGDTVPAMLEPGEVVLNREAVAAAGGASKVNKLNKLIPRFAVGGTVGMQPGITRLVKWAAKQYNLRVSSGVRPGTGSLHNTGEAADLVPPGMAATKGIFAAFKNQLNELFYDPWGGYADGQMIGAIGDHLDHIHAGILGAGTGAGVSALGAKIKLPRFSSRFSAFMPAAEGLNQNARALEKAASKAASRSVGAGHGNIGDISGPLQGTAQRLINKRWGGGQWPPFNELVMRESGWDPTAVNPSSGAAGLAQALPPSKYPAGAWPYKGKSSAVKQLQWMISYIAGRYGTPAGAISWHDAHNWYQSGGVVGPGGPGGRGSGRKGPKDWLQGVWSGWKPGGGGGGGDGLAARIKAWNALPDKKRLERAAKHAKWMDDHWRGTWPGKAHGWQMLEDASLIKSKAKGKKGKKGKSESELARLQALTELLQGQLSASKLRYAVSQAQYGVFKDMPIMHSGGPVPGPIGSNQPVMAKGGELFAGDGIQVIVHGDIYSTRKDPVEVVIGDRRFKAAVKNVRTGVGRTPGNAGLP